MKRIHPRTVLFRCCYCDVGKYDPWPAPDSVMPGGFDPDYNVTDCCELCFYKIQAEAHAKENGYRRQNAELTPASASRVRCVR
jgi:hypothetical protein